MTGIFPFPFLSFISSGLRLPQQLFYLLKRTVRLIKENKIRKDFSKDGK